MLHLGEDIVNLNSWYYREDTDEKAAFYGVLDVVKGSDMHDNPNLLLS
jgi:hypothetical protein